MAEPEYWTNPLKDEFDFTVVDCIKVRQGYEVRVKEHVARPEGGGQAGDRGRILCDSKEIPVESVIERDGLVTLICTVPLATGHTGRFKVDMMWRKAMMRNHSAEHLFMASIRRVKPEAELGYIWIDGNHGTIEIRGLQVTPVDLLAAEAEVQDLIDRDIQSSSRVVDAEGLDGEVRAREGVKTKHERVRIVSFGDHDSCACSGTHVLRTGQIGLFKIIDFKATESGLRVEFVAGHKAARFCSEVFNAVLTKKHDYPFEYEQIGSVIDKSKNLMSQYELLSDTVEELLVNPMRVETHGVIAFSSEYLPGFDSGRLRLLIKRLPLEGPTAILLFVPSQKPSFMFVINELPHPARTYLEEAVRSLGGRGGGSNEVYTGGFTESSDPESIYSVLVNALRAKLDSV